MNAKQRAEKLQQLIEESRAIDGELVGGRLEPWHFDEWLQGVNAGLADEARHAGRVQQGALV